MSPGCEHQFVAKKAVLGVGDAKELSLCVCVVQVLLMGALTKDKVVFKWGTGISTLYYSQVFGKGLPVVDHSYQPAPDQ